jgi:hypothetical protein
MTHRALGWIVAASVACGSNEDGPKSVSVRETLGERHAVEIRGAARPMLRRLEALAPDDTAWGRLVVVSVDDSTRPTGSNTPAIIGRYGVADGAIRFEPRFPFDDGTAYRVIVDTARLAREAGGVAGNSDPLTYRFAIPAVAHARTTRVVGVYPSSTRLPANLLRIYVETSAPMEVGNALERIHLVDEAGREVEGAFLALEEELWDPTRRRLTLLLDPGRVKRGVRTNVESGAPLVAGRRYRIVIDDQWKDGSGAALASGFEMAFEAIPDDRQSPNPERWSLTPPPRGTRSALHVAFGESLDHALANRLIEVVDDRGQPVPGSGALVANDSTWTFAPTTPWKSGEYTLRVGGELEDLAGNNIARLFDVDRRRDPTGVDRDVAASTRDVRFRIL